MLPFYELGSLRATHEAAGTRAHRQTRQQRGRLPPRGRSTPVPEGPATTKGKSATLTEADRGRRLTHRAPSDPGTPRSKPAGSAVSGLGTKRTYAVAAALAGSGCAGWARLAGRSAGRPGLAGRCAGRCAGRRGGWPGLGGRPPDRRRAVFGTSVPAVGLDYLPGHLGDLDVPSLRLGSHPAKCLVRVAAERMHQHALSLVDHGPRAVRARSRTRCTEHRMPRRSAASAYSGQRFSPRVSEQITGARVRAASISGPAPATSSRSASSARSGWVAATLSSSWSYHTVAVAPAQLATCQAAMSASLRSDRASPALVRFSSSAAS